MRKIPSEFRKTPNCRVYAAGALKETRGKVKIHGFVVFNSLVIGGLSTPGQTDRTSAKGVRGRVDAELRLWELGGKQAKQVHS